MVLRDGTCFDFDFAAAVAHRLWARGAPDRFDGERRDRGAAGRNEAREVLKGRDWMKEIDDRER